ncbi:MAG: ParB N-terminal domain-containing protein [Pseudomonadota bacterium]
MAKRKRLSPANPDVFGATADAAPAPTRAPIADVAGETAATAALHDVTRALTDARVSGRMVLSLPLTDIVLDHIVRDRVIVDKDEMAALMTSIAARGQQTPIEVLETKSGQYGLISGWRRCQAIARLARDGRHDGQVLALLRAPADASETYQAMVEENEIRVGLSYFERARIAAKAVEQGVFPTEKAALLALFASASRAKRSKIRSFLPVVAAFGQQLRYPHQIGERLGLSLAAALEEDPCFLRRVQGALAAIQSPSPEAEQAALVKALEQQKNQFLIVRDSDTARVKPIREAIRPTLRAKWDEDGHWLHLSGADMTPALRARILEFLKSVPKA